MYFMLKFLAFMMMILGTMITVSFFSFPLVAWLGLELNSLGFIPLMKNKNNPSTNESMLKYYLIQTISSSFFLIPSLISPFINNLMVISSLNSIMMIFMNFALLSKLGSAPFHYWMFPLVNSLSWFPFMLFMTWQKIAPLFLLSNFSMSNLITVSILISILISPIMMINQNSIKMILAYASIAHQGWMMSSLFFNMILFFQYFFIYMMISIFIMYFFMHLNMQFLNQISFINNKNKFFLILNLLSIGGFPPLMMFLPKVNIIFQLSQNQTFYYMALFLLMSSLLMFYSYVHLNFPFSVMSAYNFPLKITSNYNMFFVILFSFLTIFIVPILFM